MVRRIAGILFLLGLSGGGVNGASCPPFGYSVQLSGVELAEDRWSVSDLIEVARRSLPKGADGLAILDINIPGSGTPLPKPPSAFGYDYWAGMRERIVRGRSQGIAQAIALGPDAVLRYWLPGGRAEKVVLRGRDPLIWADGFEIVYVDACTHAAAGRLLVAAQPIEIFVRSTGSFTGTDAGRMAQRLMERIPGTPIRAYFRTDEWFVFDGRYPFVNPYIEEGGPNEALINRNQTIRCSGASGSPVRCVP